jgi:adenylate kinase
MLCPALDIDEQSENLRPVNWKFVSDRSVEAIYVLMNIAPPHPYLFGEPDYVLHEVNCELVMIILESVFYWIIAIAPPHPG